MDTIYTIYIYIHYIQNGWYEQLFSFKLRGKGGVPGGQIMENEFEYLTDRGGYGDHLAEKFLKKYCS